MGRTLNVLGRLTDSMCRSFRTCPRKCFYSYELRRRPRVKADALTRGTSVHAWLEEFWKGNIAPVVHADPYERARIEAMVDGYRARWGKPDGVEAVEQEFLVPLVNPATGAASKTFAHAGKVDAIAIIDGDRYVVEHKTSSEDIGAGSNYWKKLRLDSQVSGYLRAVEAVGVLYDVLKVPQIRPYRATPTESRKYTKDGRLYANQRDVDESPEDFGIRCAEAIMESPDDYYQRGVVVRLEDESEEAAADLWMVGRSIADARRLNRWPRNPGACFNYNRPCDYFDVCTGADYINNDVVFETTEEHQELSK